MEVSHSGKKFCKYLSIPDGIHLFKLLFPESLSTAWQYRSVTIDLIVSDLQLVRKWKMAS